ncbi:MAG TPA: nitroreductase [Thermodesulfovibrionales bacterium]|nr:nitroreductase [Thermodesulfovibrionales bacterium]
MDAIECIKTRMSIRKFKPNPVPLEILKNVINTAKWSPSYKNTQPWEVIIVSGKKKEELSKTLVELLERNTEPLPDIPEPMSWPPAIEARITALMKKRSELTGVDMFSLEALRRAKLANFQFYGAPHGIFLFQDSSLTAWSIFDMGLFAQSFMLAAHAYGLGTVPQAFLTDYAQHVKQFLGILESKRLVLGISIGYPDLESPMNKFRPGRIETDEIVRVVE